MKPKVVLEVLVTLVDLLDHPNRTPCYPLGFLYHLVCPYPLGRQLV